MRRLEAKLEMRKSDAAYSIVSKVARGILSPLRWISREKAVVLGRLMSKGDVN